VLLETAPKEAGDVRRTGGSIEKAQALLGWQPEVTLREGLAEQVAWSQAVQRRQVANVA
jgi:UDP-glucose 4-epimerase